MEGSDPYANSANCRKKAPKRRFFSLVVLCLRLVRYNDRGNEICQNAGTCTSEQYESKSYECRVYVEIICNTSAYSADHAVFP